MTGQAPLVHSGREQPPPPGPEAREPAPSEADIADAYSVLVAQGLFGDFDLRYARLFEDLELDAGVCRRRVRLLWRLPSFKTLEEALPQPKRIVIPLTIMRRGQLYTSLELEARNDVAIRIISRRSSTRLTRMMLDDKWSRALDELIASGLAADAASSLDTDVYGLLTDVVDGLAREAREAVTMIERTYRRTVNTYGLSRLDALAYNEFIRLAHRLGRRHIIWVELASCSPGDAIELEYAYFTRFPDEPQAIPISRGRVTKAYQAWKRWVGQPPSVITLPISRYALTRSYHVTFRVAEHNFLDQFEFVDLLPTGPNATSFSERAKDDGAQLSGGDEAGGPVGHLYCHEMASSPHAAVRAKIMERPPGATASVAWLCLVSSLITVGLLINWHTIFQPQPPRILQVALPIPGIAAIWFAHVFHIDSRRRLPVAARLGLYATVAMSAFLLVLLMVAAGQKDGKSPLPMWSVIVIAAVIQGGTMCYAWFQRVHFYKRYQAHQVVTARKYGL